MKTLDTNLKELLVQYCLDEQTTLTDSKYATIEHLITSEFEVNATKLLSTHKLWDKHKVLDGHVATLDNLLYDHKLSCATFIPQTQTSGGLDTLQLHDTDFRLLLYPDEIRTVFLEEIQSRLSMHYRSTVSNYPEYEFNRYIRLIKSMIDVDHELTAVALGLLQKYKLFDIKEFKIANDSVILNKDTALDFAQRICESTGFVAEMSFAIDVFTRRTLAEPLGASYRCEYRRGTAANLATLRFERKDVQSGRIPIHATDGTLHGYIVPTHHVNLVHLLTRFYRFNYAKGK